MLFYYLLFVGRYIYFSMLVRHRKFNLFFFVMNSFLFSDLGFNLVCYDNIYLFYIIYVGERKIN